jgi:NADH-quinone oxidoreductase subunit H
MAGLGSGNKYALLGGVRAAAQMISYEIPLVLSVLAVAMMAQSLDLREITEQQALIPNIVWQPLGFFIFIIASTAEMGRRPFDIPVSESEMVGGPSVEYSGIRWSMFQLGEYANLVIISVFGSVLFLGGYAWPFGLDWGWGWQLALTVIKASMFVVLFMWINGTFPRLRIDQVMSFAWKGLIPLSLVQIFVSGLVKIYDWPDIIMGIVSGVAVILAAMIIRQRVTRTGLRPREERLAYLRARRAAREAGLGM